MRSALALFSLLFFSALMTGESSAPTMVHHSSFSVVGIEIRTSNADEASNGSIGRLWQRFFQQSVLQKIPNKADSNIYAVYSDYTNGHNGEYSLTIGAKVKNGSAVPDGMVLKRIPDGDYNVFTSDKGPVANVVTAAWKRVWVMEDQHQLGGHRAYKGDFELYDQRAQDPQNSQVDLYIGLK